MSKILIKIQQWFNANKLNIFKNPLRRTYVIKKQISRTGLYFIKLKNRKEDTKINRNSVRKETEEYCFVNNTILLLQ